MHFEVGKDFGRDRRRERFVQLDFPDNNTHRACNLSHLEEQEIAKQEETYGD